MHLPHYWQDDVSGNRLINISWYFNHGIDAMKITALSNHKPGILSNYIRMSGCKYFWRFDIIWISDNHIYIRVRILRHVWLLFNGWLVRCRNCLPLTSTWVNTRVLVGPVLLTYLVFCGVFLFCLLVFVAIVVVLFVFVLCLVCPMLPLFLDCLRPVSCVPNVAIVSRLSILDSRFSLTFIYYIGIDRDTKTRRRTTFYN